MQLETKKEQLEDLRRDYKLLVKSYAVLLLEEAKESHTYVLNRTQKHSQNLNNLEKIIKEM